MSDLVRADAGALAEAAADWMAARFAAAPGRLAVSLSGGSTPRLLYAALAKRADVPWDRVHWFWGDERFVPPDDAKSNFRMVREAMLDQVPVPPGNVHPVPTQGLTPAEAARAYEAELRRFAEGSGNEPLFDLVLLGIGTNGHTASLFPGEAVVEERDAWAAPVSPPGEPVRITLCWPALENCRAAAFVVTGAEKAEVVRRVRARDPALVASAFRPRGELMWWTDEAAAGAAAGG